MTELEYMDKFKREQIDPLWDSVLIARDAAQGALDQIQGIRSEMMRRQNELLTAEHAELSKHTRP